MSGVLTLTVTSPIQSPTEPLTAAEVIMHMGLTAPSPVDSEFEAELEMFIEAAREQAEILQGQDLVAKQWDQHQDCFDAWEIELRRPLASVDLIRYRKSDGSFTTLVEGTDYVVDTARGVVTPVYGGGWPSVALWPTSAVLIRFTVAAPSNLPRRLKVGMLQLVSDWYNDRMPFSKGIDAAEGYPMRLKMLLSTGGRSQIA